MSVEAGAVVAIVVAAIVLFAWLFVWIIHTISLVFGCRHLYKRLEPVIPADELPGISIIKPLTGVEPHLKSNLETFFVQEYPKDKLEILFSVQDDNDPAILVVKSLIDCYPKVDAKLFIGLRHVGPNGKVNNMVRPYEAAKFDNILISDTSIKMTPTTLYEMAHCLRPDVGLVLQMPYCATRKGFGAVYQQIYFGTMQARNCLSANATGINCSTGMSSMVRRNVLDKSGGLAAFGKYLAEDHFIAQSIKKQGYKIVLSTTPALQNSGTSSLTEFHKRLVRWCQLRISMVPNLIILEPLGECFIIGTLASWAANCLFDVSPLAFFLGHILLWFFFDYILFRVVENGPLPFSKFEFVVGWLMREFAAPYLILLSHLQDSVVWRNKRYKLRWGGKVDLAKSEGLQEVVTM